MHAYIRSGVPTGRAGDHVSRALRTTTEIWNSSRFEGSSLSFAVA